MSFSAFDVAMMHEALKLAEKGLYTTSPNPRVGCVIVNDQQHIIAQGWHEKAGQAHAEINALKMVGAQAKGSTVYVTLEPCSHFGKTPPCVQALIQAKVKRVVIAMLDPNPLVNGQGMAQLVNAGIQCDTDLLSDMAQELNIGFVKRMQQHRPWIRLKSAASLDGRTALLNGDSQWITSEIARHDVHKWRARACAIVTGIGTIQKDDPLLNVRLQPNVARQPLRFVLDTHLKISPHAKILQEKGTIVVTGESSLASRRDFLVQQGVALQVLPIAKDGHVDLALFFEKLADYHLNEVHIEAGSTLSGAMVAQGLVDEWLLYLAPKIIGSSSKGLLDLPLLTHLEQAKHLRIQDMCQIGPDIRILSRFS